MITTVTPTAGIHHVTAICGDAQRNVDFYAGVLGLRLVKRTVNFDDPQTYHLYYGDEIGDPGSLLTFFPWPDATRGRVGPGQVAVVSFAVAANALGFWIERLLHHVAKFRGPIARRVGDVDEQVLSFEDGDGLMLEIVATPLAGDHLGWNGAPGISAEVAIRGVHGVTLWEEDGGPTIAVLTDLLGLEKVDEDGTTQRFAAGSRGARSIADVRTVGAFPRGNISVGTVHHVAWRVPTDLTQLEQRARLVAAGLDPTPVIDRQYFHSVYFFEPGGVLFELATDGPGFAIDEPPSHLGEQLMLPPQYEPARAQIAASLPEIHLPAPAAAYYRDE
jgi:catechol 2,3-dioxygenase-like lactoylglutathione lyase family enzyme